MLYVAYTVVAAESAQLLSVLTHRGTGGRDTGGARTKGEKKEAGYSL